MPESNNNALAKKKSEEDFRTRRPVFILENQLMDTLELQWHVQQARVRLSETADAKIQGLFDGLTGELRMFTETIQNRLQSLRSEGPRLLEWTSSSFWRLFSKDDVNGFSQFEAL